MRNMVAPPINATTATRPYASLRCTRLSFSTRRITKGGLMTNTTTQESTATAVAQSSALVNHGGRYDAALCAHPPTVDAARTGQGRTSCTASDMRTFGGCAARA